MSNLFKSDQTLYFFFFCKKLSIRTYFELRENWGSDFGSEFDIIMPWQKFAKIHILIQIQLKWTKNLNLAPVSDYLKETQNPNFGYKCMSNKWNVYEKLIPEPCEHP